MHDEPQSGSESQDPRRGILFGSSLLYGALLLLALAWSALRGLDLNLFGGSVVFSLLVGGAGALALLAFGWISGVGLPVARRLADEMAALLVDENGAATLLAVALLSGVCEEILFRGVLQQEFGLVAASVVFGAAHFVPQRRFLIWTAYAVVAGFFLGWLYIATGGLAAPITAHVVNNAFVLLYWKYRRRGSTSASGNDLQGERK